MCPHRGDNAFGLERVKDALEFGQGVAAGFLEHGVGLDPQVIRLDQHSHQSLVASRRLTHLAIQLRSVPHFVLHYHLIDATTMPVGEQDFLVTCDMGDSQDGGVEPGQTG